MIGSTLLTILATPGCDVRFGSIFDRGEPTSKSRHVGYAPESGRKIELLASTLMGLCRLMVSPWA